MCEMWTLLPQTSKSSLSEVHRRYLHHSAKQFPGFLLETGHINTLNYSLRKTDSRVFIGNWLLQPSAYHRSTFQYLRRTVFYTIKVCIYLPVQEQPPPNTHILNAAFTDASPGHPCEQAILKDCHFLPGT